MITNVESHSTLQQAVSRPFIITVSLHWHVLHGLKLNHTTSFWSPPMTGILLHSIHSIRPTTLDLHHRKDVTRLRVFKVERRQAFLVTFL